MKRILVLMLAIACTLGMLVSCGGSKDDGGSKALQDFAAKVNATTAEEIVCVVDMTTEDGDSVGFELVYTGEDDPEIDIEFLGKLNIGDVDNNGDLKAFVVKKIGKLSQGDDMNLSKLNFDKANFKEGSVEITDAKFTAVVSNPSAFFGADVDAKAVNITIHMRDGAVDEIELVYTTHGVKDVKATITYN